MAPEGRIIDGQLLKTALACKCPKCGVGDLYKPGFLNLSLIDICPSCGFALAANDNGDGPAVFLIFILGFLLVPLALLVDHLLTPPLWVHAVVWTVVTLSITLGLLKPVKAYVLALQLKHRS